MLKRILLILLTLYLSCYLTYGQDQLELRRMNIKPAISKQISYLLKDSTSCETIIYSVFNLDYHIVINKKQHNYNLFFFKFQKTDTQPVLMYYSYIPLNKENFERLFNKKLYWKERNFFNYTPSDNDNGWILESNISDFCFYEVDGSIIAEFHLPTFTDENPLRFNHQFLLDLRMDLILEYILENDRE